MAPNPKPFWGVFTKFMGSPEQFWGAYATRAEAEAAAAEFTQTGYFRVRIGRTATEPRS